MNNAQALANRMTEVEKMGVRATSPDGLIALYHYSYRAELKGGALKGGTEEEGIAEMQETAAILHERFVEDSRNPGFGNTWLF